MVVETTNTKHTNNDWVKTYNEAVDYYKNQNYEQSIKLGKRAQRIASNDYGKKSSQYVESSFLIGNSYTNLGQNLESIEYFENVIYWGLLIKDVENLVFISIEYCEVFKFQFGQLDSGILFFQSLIDNNSNMPNYVKAKIHGSLFAFYKIGDVIKANEHGELAISLFKKSEAASPNHPRYKDFAYMLDNYASHRLYGFNTHQSVFGYYREARETLFNLELNYFVADRILINYVDAAFAHLENFDRQGAIDLLHESLEVMDSFAQYGINIEQYDHYNLLVESYLALEKPVKAVMYAQEYIRLLRRNKADINESDYLQILSRALYFEGKSYFKLGESTEAEQSLKKSIELINGLNEFQAVDPVLSSYFYLRYYDKGLSNISTLKVKAIIELINLYIFEGELEQALNQINDLRDFFDLNNDHESILHKDFLLAQLNFYKAINGHTNILLVADEIIDYSDKHMTGSAFDLKVLLDVLFASIESTFGINYSIEEIEELIQSADIVLEEIFEFKNQEVNLKYKADLNSYKAKFHLYKNGLNSSAYLTDLQIDSILHYSEKALSLYNIVSNDKREYETSLMISKMRFFKGERKESINSFKKTIASFSDKVTSTNIALAYGDLAELYFHNKEYDLALQNIDSAFEQFADYYITSIFSLSEEDKLDVKSDLTTLFNAYSTYLVNSPELYRSNSQISKYFKKYQWLNSVTLDNLGLVKKLVEESNNENIRQAYKAWVTQKERLSQLYLSNANTDVLIYEQVIANRLEEELYKLFLDDDNYENISPTIDWSSNITNNLSQNESAVQIIKYNNSVAEVTESNYAAIIIERDQPPRLIPIEESDQLETNYYSYYRSHIENQILDEKSYARFWGQIDKNINKNNTIYYSGDGIYQLMNPLTLYNVNTTSYLLNELNLIQTEDLLATLEQGVDLEIKKISSASLFGSPNYTLDSHDKSFSGTHNYFNQLPGTEREITSISALLKEKGVRSSAFLFENALEKMVKGVISPSILHIATHGYFDQTELKNETSEVELGAISFNRANGLTRTTGDLFRNNMVRSGLIFAGANDFLSNNQKHLEEDGILTALEVSDLNLINTELVVLSACETGSGELVDGEGVFGLKRALKVAGVKAMVISLWEVDDQATNELMVSFYSNLLESNNIGEALKKSQLELESKYAHPYYWGPFILTSSN